MAARVGRHGPFEETLHRYGRTAPLDLTESEIRGRPMKEIRKGFSLIELLVVIAVIGLLGAIVTVSLAKVRERAASTECLQNLRSLAAGVLLYTNENDGRLPNPLGTDSNGWEALIAPYLGYETTDVPIAELHCPADPKPLDDGHGNFGRSYLFNGLIDRDLNQPYGLIAFSVPSANSPASGKVRRMQNLVHPSKTIMLFERMTGMSPPYDTLPAYQFSSSWSFANGWFSGKGPRFPGGDSYHGNTMNFAFADGHVESLSPEASYTPVNLWRAID